MKSKEYNLILFRHGETDWNSEGRLQGQTDTKLNPNGIEQAEKLGQVLKEEGLEILFSSDLTRARETSQVVAKILKLDIVYHIGLREISLGEAQGLLESDILPKFGKKAYSQWKEAGIDSDSFRFPGGESKKEASNRICKTIQDLIQLHNRTKIGICTHGFVMDRFCERFTDQTKTHTKIGNCEVRKIIYSKPEEVALNV
ncbi:histidine phosphatase family protein [Leptospira langatensis]|uniref:Histidine phosphatase family protein n=1 Tax=Leptospira langatensis TaxID=2484983 RepID=A0A5F1ZZA4_9LEPT|nr:histidine phosphatase family protein [Leptospira langatensis]TGJ98422.1 histidine phosphatase family protein [Leptospira langatensis]TGL43337.1 histidine phosphatase family protein [Leptospira langatensis]